MSRHRIHPGAGFASARNLALGLAALVLTFGSGTALGQSEGDPGSMGVLQELTLDASDHVFGWPETIDVGRVAVTMENTGTEPHHAQLLKLRPGVTLEQVQAALPALEEEPELLFSQVEFAGGPGIIVPGMSQRVILDIGPGTYAWLCGIPSADGVPHYAKGMLHQFEAVIPQDGPPPAVMLPDRFVVLQDFAFGLPATLPAGPQRWEVNNEGTQDHEMLLAKLDEGATAMDFVMSAFDPGATPPGIPFGGLQAIPSEGYAWLDLDLAPGTYAAFCFVPDPETGQAHLELGMIAEFTVTG